MGEAEFEAFEQQFLELVGELNTVTASESRVRESLRVESTRAEAAEAGMDAAERAAAEARTSAAAATAAATQATAALAAVNDELTQLKMQLELAERERSLLEVKCAEMSAQISSLETDLHQLKPLQSAQATLQRQYVDLQERIRVATKEAKSEASRLEMELRRVEKATSGGAEIRERARLAAATHARDKKLAHNELQHTAKQLLRANGEISRLGGLVAELQYRLSNEGHQSSPSKKHLINVDALAEAKAALEAERAENSRLERTLAAALADNATLASHLNAKDNVASDENNTPFQLPKVCSNSSTIRDCPIDSFLAE